MIKRISNIKVLPDYKLHVEFDDGKIVCYDVADDIAQPPVFAPLKTERGLFHNVQLDESCTCVYWSDEIDLPSDAIYEYGEVIKAPSL